MAGMCWPRWPTETAESSRTTSWVRKAAGIDFHGWDPSISSLIAEVELSEEPEWGIRYDANGTQAIGKLDDGNRAGVVVTQPFAGQSREPTLHELSSALVAVWGTDYGVRSATWISRFTDMTRQAPSYRNGRVLLAGDAAHVHYPIGGQGLDLGVQDAVNLGWKLALRHTMAQTALARSDARIDALRDTMAELLSMEEPRKRFAATVAGLDIRYDLGDGHPLLGRRMPDLDLVTGDGAPRVFDLLGGARAVLLNVNRPSEFDTSRWSDRVLAVDAEYHGDWELPALGRVPAPAAVLVRPDGYVAWVGDGTGAGLHDALTTWFGSR